MIKKIFMVSTVIVLVFLIMITPTFFSEHQSLGAVPLVLVDNLKYDVLIDVHSVVVEYRYRNISMRITGLDNLSYRPPVLTESDTYDLHVTVSKNVTHKFELNVTLFDQNLRGFDFNATIEVKGEIEDYAVVVQEPHSDQSIEIAIGATYRDTLNARRVSG